MISIRALMVLTFMLVAVTGSAGGGGKAVESTDDLHQVVYHAGGSSPMFIPERVLQEKTPEEVLTPAGAAMFRNHVRAQRTPGLFLRHGKAGYPLCESIEETKAEGGAVELSRIQELINGHALGIIAKVTGVTAGWLAQARGVAELAKLEVLEVLDHSTGRSLVAPGEILRITTPGGQLRFQDVVLCKESRTSMQRPREGERVLVIGVPGESQPPGYFDDWMVFEIRGNDVILQAERATGTVLRSTSLVEVLDGVTPLQRDQQ